MSRRIAVLSAVCAAWLGCDVYTPDLLQADGVGGSPPPSTNSSGGAGGNPGGGASSTSTTTTSSMAGGGGEGGQGGRGGDEGGAPPLGGAGGAGGSPPLGGAWINELHYDNASVDAAEGVEVAGPAGLNLTGWSLVAYNGNGGAISVSASTVNLTGVLPNQMNGFGTKWFAMPGLENGAPDGIALVDAADVVVQFLSYEGAFAATAGPANGTTSINLPVDEEPAPAVGMSLQLTGAGNSYAEFTWAEGVVASPDQVNGGQVLQ